MLCAYTPQTPLASPPVAWVSLPDDGAAPWVTPQVVEIGQQRLLYTAAGAWCLLGRNEFALLEQAYQERPLWLCPPAGANPEAWHAARELLWRVGLLGPQQEPFAPPAPDRLEVTMVLTERCNLACTYCYLGVHHHHRATASRDWAERTVDRALRSGFAQVVIDLGEITSCGPLFRHLVRYARQATARDGAPSLTLSIQTNGATLDEETLDFLQEHDVFIGLSLDGPAALHDQVRLTAGGRGSHARTVAALQRLNRRGLPYIVLCTVSQANAGHAALLLDTFAEMQVGHFSFKPVIRRGHADARWQSVGVTVEVYRQFLDDYLAAALRRSDWWGLDETLIRYAFRLLRDARGWASACGTAWCDAGASRVAFDPAGRAYACPRFISFDSEADAIAYDWSPVAGPARPAPAACAGCPWLAYCGGGCPVDRAAADPWCAIYDQLYQLLVTRLLPHVAHIGSGTGEKLGCLTVVDIDLFHEPSAQTFIPGGIR